MTTGGSVPTAAMEHSPLILFDADCGFCSASARLLSRWGAGGEYVAMQTVDLVALSVDPARAQRELPAVQTDGTVVYGASAIAVSLAAGPRWMRGVAAVMAWPVVSTCSSIVYRFIASHRHQLFAGSDQCRVPEKSHRD